MIMTIAKLKKFAMTKSENVVSEWICYDCGIVVYVGPEEYQSIGGTPVCPDCDEDMRYSRVLVRRAPEHKTEARRRREAFDAQLAERVKRGCAK